MNQRKLGRTGLEVSEIGYGAWGIGKSMWLGAEDDESLRALNRAIDLGVTLIDTALGYGNGHSEELVGEIVRSRSERIAVATKIPPKNRRWPSRSRSPPLTFCRQPLHRRPSHRLPSHSTSGSILQG